MIYNSSSFRIGQKYYFNIQDGDKTLEDVECIVIAKGNRKMQLQIADKVEWYNNVNLTPTRSVHRPKISPTTAKIISKPVVVEAIKPISSAEMRDRLVKEIAQNYERYFPQPKNTEKDIILPVDHFDWSSLKGENADDALKMAFITVKKSLRDILVARGYGKVAELTPKTSTMAIINLVRKYLPQYGVINR